MREEHIRHIEQYRLSHPETRELAWALAVAVRDRPL